MKNIYIYTQLNIRTYIFRETERHTSEMQTETQTRPLVEAVVARRCNGVKSVDPCEMC